MNPSFVCFHLRCFSVTFFTFILSSGSWQASEVRMIIDVARERNETVMQKKKGFAHRNVNSEQEIPRRQYTYFATF